MHNADAVEPACLVPRRATQPQHPSGLLAGSPVRTRGRATVAWFRASLPGRRQRVSHAWNPGLPCLMTEAALLLAGGGKPVPRQRGRTGR